MNPKTPPLNHQYNQGFGLTAPKTGARSGTNLKPYRGRFAPSPTGPLHLGSLVTALGSWLDARAHDGAWVVRIEDVDTSRIVPGGDQLILTQLKAYGLEWDEEPIWQSQRTTLYQVALNQLMDKGLIYACQCSRKEIESALLARGAVLLPREELAYPGTCRERRQSHKNHALRIRLPEDCEIDFADRSVGKQAQDLNKQIGDFVLRRADGIFTYQLAVVVDDYLQDITHVVRGEDLLTNTARQIHLQQCLAYQTPMYLHLPLVNNKAGEKLSKQTKASAIPTDSAESILNTLDHAAYYLGIKDEALSHQTSITHWIKRAIDQWKKYVLKNDWCL